MTCSGNEVWIEEGAGQAGAGWLDERNNDLVDCRDY